jgi:hypothetical protein
VTIAPVSEASFDFSVIRTASGALELDLPNLLGM